MYSRKGVTARSIACSSVMSPSMKGRAPSSQAAVKTGSMTKKVRKRERLMIMMLGGVCWTPRP
jgi:hypothetical protein